MKILITAAGTGNAYAYSLAKTKNFSEIILHTGDINPANLVTSSIFSNYFHNTPQYSHENFTKEIKKIITNHNIDYYLPLIDDEILNASNDIFLSKKLAANSLKFNNFCVKKHSYHKLDCDLIKHPNQIKSHKDIPDVFIANSITSSQKKYRHPHNLRSDINGDTLAH